jgi:hypothetical protein
MSISISTVGKTLGCIFVVVGCSWSDPVQSQVFREDSNYSFTPNLLAQNISPGASPNTSLGASLEERAALAYSQGDAPLAVFLYSRLLEQQPNSYLFQVRLAVALLNSGPEYVNESYAAFQKARELNPNIDEPLIFMGRIEEALELNQVALENYQRAYELNTASQDAFIGIQRIQAQVSLPPLPDGLEVIKTRSLDEYLAAVEPNSRLIAGLRAQRSIMENLVWRNAFPNLSLGYSWSESTSESVGDDVGDPCIGGRRQSSQQVCGAGSSRSDGFSIGVSWNLTDLLFGDSNQLRLRGYNDLIASNLEQLQTEVKRLYTRRGSIMEEFQQLAWQAALNPSDREIRYNRRDRYLQILYLTQQIHSITGLY